MKHKLFRAVATHPQDVSIEQPTMVGIWTRRPLTPEQRAQIIALNKHSDGRLVIQEPKGHIGVRESKFGTTVRCTLRVADERTARVRLAALVKQFSQITGRHAIFRRLQNYRTVSRALAG